MCQEVIELMQRYLDRDLDETEYSRMLGHLQQCPDCSELFERLVNLSQELESLPKVTPPYSLVDAILPQPGGAGRSLPCRRKRNGWSLSGSQRRIRFLEELPGLDVPEAGANR
ncbi:zf-HC2 domain-containing protein [Paenibacillus sp. P26]|nr:zf-HC2 domain-containing protein [Paenibacillus sp. P26]